MLHLGRKVTVVVAMFGSTLVGTAALATHNGGSLGGQTTGAKFTQGSWVWYHNGESCGGDCVGGWQRWGNIVDTNCGDNDTVYDETRVEAYGWARIYGTGCGTRFVNHVYRDPQATKVTHRLESVSGG